MTDVFVSYKAEDRRRIAPLVSALEADGFSVWWDQQIDGGAAWRRMIEAELNAARSVIVAWSKRSVGEQGEFVQDEATRAQQRRVYIPVTIDKVHLPLGFGETHALPLAGWSGDRSDPRYQAVLAAVRKIAGEREAREPTTAPAISRRTAIAGSAVAAALAGVGGWALLKPKSAEAASRIAVLPFANLSGDPAQNYFADGLAEELRGALSRLGGLRVIGRVSSEAVRNSEATEAARRLGAGTLVIGSVRRSPSLIRVSAQLLDGTDGAERWAETYDRPPGDVLAVQADIAENVARALSIQLGRAERDALVAGGTRNPAALDLYLKAQAKFASVNTRSGEEEAIGLLDAAVALDPRFASAIALKSIYLTEHLNSFGGEETDVQRGYAEAEASARRALAIAPGLGLGYAALGRLSTGRLDAVTGVKMYERALAYSPGDTEALVGYARLLGDVGRIGRASSLAERLIVLDPLDPAIHSFRSLIHFYSRQYADAIRAAQRALEISPQRYVAHMRIGDSLVMLGKPREALAEYQRMPADDPWRLVGTAIATGRLGDRTASDRALGDLGHFGESWSFQIAEIHALRRESDAAFASLQRALELRDPGLLALRVDPFLDSIRSDARYASLVKGLRLP
jgi:serine/threonine-protein kinase